jgi:hypothetical protein
MNTTHTKMATNAQAARTVCWHSIAFLDLSQRLQEMYMAFCSPHTVTQHPHDQEHNTQVRTLETRTLPHSAHERTVRVSLLRSNPSLALIRCRQLITPAVLAPVILTTSRHTRLTRPRTPRARTRAAPAERP